MACAICNSPQRAEIEQALMNVGPSLTTEAIAEQYNVPLEDLKVHALFHTPLGLSSEEDNESIARKLKMRESDMLTEVATEYLITMKGVGRKLNEVINSVDSKFGFRTITKAQTDLYLGLGSEIRKTVAAIAEIDQILNGPKEDNTSGLAALAAAINASGRNN